MTTLIRPLESPADLRLAFGVLRELRESLTWESFHSLYQQAREHNGYALVGLEVQGQLVAVMGYRLLIDFIHGKHLYIDDLVTTQALRSKGYGTQLLDHAEALARQLGCQGLRLCTGVENESGKRFYERLGWKARALAYKKPFLSAPV